MTQSTRSATTPSPQATKDRGPNRDHPPVPYSPAGRNLEETGDIWRRSPGTIRGCCLRCARPARDLGRYPDCEVTDRGVGDPMQDHPVQRLTQGTERGPVYARHGQQGDLIAVRSEPKIGVQNRE